MGIYRYSLLQNTALPAMLGMSVLATDIAYAVEFKFRPRIEAGMEYYRIERDNLFKKDGDTVTSASEVELDDWMPIISGGITIFADRFFVDASGLMAVDGEDNFDRNVSTSNPQGQGLALAKGDADIDRWEYSVSLGYMLTENLSVFGGYKKAEADIDYDSKVTISSPIGDISGRYKFDSTFEQDGPFLGLAYGWNVDTSFFKGVLSANVAVASLDGETKISNVKSSLPASAELPDDETKGDTIGAKLGFAWIGSTAVEGLTYSLGMDGYKYEFDADDNDETDITETVINLKAGISYLF